jgi:hypothetical protein
MQRPRADPDLGRDLLHRRRHARQVPDQRRRHAIHDARRRARRVADQQLANQLARAGRQPRPHRHRHRIAAEHQRCLLAEPHRHPARRLPRRHRHRRPMPQHQPARPPAAPDHLARRARDRRDQVLHADPHPERGPAGHIEDHMNLAAPLLGAHAERVGHVPPVRHGHRDDLADRPARQRRELHQAQVLVDRPRDDQGQRGPQLAHRLLPEPLGMAGADSRGERRISRARPFLEHEPVRPRGSDHAANSKHRFRRHRRHDITLSQSKPRIPQNDHLDTNTVT